MPRDWADWANYIGGCGFQCGVSYTEKASSNLAPQKGNNYEVKESSDLDSKTAWASSGVGEWVEYLFTRVSNDGITVNTIAIASGYQKSPETWANNSRPRRLRVDFNGKTLGSFELADTQRLQEVRFPGAGQKIKKGDKLRLTITDFYHGDLYVETCISELLLSGAGVRH